MAAYRDTLRRFNRFRRLQKRNLLLACGFDLYIKSRDRDVLEKMIFPFILQHSEFSKILFVGCHWYTNGYAKWFKEKKFCTMDNDPDQAKWGSQNHVVDSVENIRLHFEDGELDAIICNGVFGWGLNTRAVAEKAFSGCYETLRVGGLLVLGWNDVPEHAPFQPEECASLQDFSPYVFPLFSSARHMTEGPNRHIYDFFVKN